MNDAESPDRSLEPALDLATLAAGRPGSYRVLARKYRPASFEDLIGQDAMVRTLTNAFETKRIPQAWILTGVRGVGKTTTARILARALNYQTTDSGGEPTVHMPALGIHCQAIMESRHVDVIEMDAASHNSVDDVRQINDAIRYAPVSARYKVYILDEVHMLSTAAFNALLKTLEEPPPHAKFVFATTEIRKVPVTVLSRCQRFDLRRVDSGLLVQHLRGICDNENVSAEPDALALIARAAEGSVRDALSLLDQAIAHASGNVRAEDVRQMLGLADRVRIIDLFEAVMRGDAATALKELRDLYDCGADPAVVLTDLAEFTHLVTRVKIVPAAAQDASLPEAERRRARDLASLSMGVLSRTWQMLLKGIGEVGAAPKPLAAAEMVVVRIAYAADLPAPDELVRQLRAAGPSPDPTKGNGGSSGMARPSASMEMRSAPAARSGSAALAPAATPFTQAPEGSSDAAAVPIGRFEDVIALAAEKRDLILKSALERDVRLVRFEPGRIEIALEPTAAKTLVGDLSRKLFEWTGRRWMVTVSREAGAPTLRAQAEAQRQEFHRGVVADPLVQAVLARFPGAQIVGVRQRAHDAAPAPLSEDAAVAGMEFDDPNETGDSDS